MLFLVNNMLPRELADLLLAYGHEAKTVGRLRIGSNEDVALWQLAEQTGAIVVSKDNDFAPLATQLHRAQFVHIRTGNISTARLLDRMRDAMPYIMKSLEEGEKIVEVW